MRVKGFDPAFPPANGMTGLTKREYFAAMAMQGLLAADVRGTDEEHWTAADIASFAVNQADLLIESLNEDEG